MPDRFRQSRALAAALSLSACAAAMPLPLHGHDTARPPATTGTGDGEGRAPAAVGTAADDSASGSPPSAASPGAYLDRARELIKTGDYDGATETLRAAVAGAREQPDLLRDAYLLHVKTLVFRHNEWKHKAQGREAADMFYAAARDTIVKCLGIPALRRTRAEPAVDYPEEMIDLFAKVRGDIFGAFRVAERDPPDAVVLLDGDTLRAFPGDSVPGDVDLAIGAHRVVVGAPGYRLVIEEVDIKPGVTLDRSYRLSRRRGAAWYGTVAGAVAAGVAGIVAVTRRGSGTSSLEPLPPAPDPPAR